MATLGGNAQTDHAVDSENTPLLRSAQFNATERSLPPILPTVERLLTVDIDSIHDEDLQPASWAIPNPSESVTRAFALVVLLQLYTRKLRAKSRVHGIYETWDQLKARQSDAELLGKKIDQLWSQFLDEYRTSIEIDTVLWTAFSDDVTSPNKLRVVDCLKDRDAPSNLVLHPVVDIALSETWRNGNSVLLSGSSLEWARRYDAISTPRSTHFIDFIAVLTFALLLTHYVLHPPRRPHIFHAKEEFGAREILLLIYAISLVLRPLSFLVVSPVLVLIAFASCLPSVPYPGEVSFGVLLGALPLCILQMHLPTTPGPLFIFSKDRSLPLALFIGHGLSRITTPVLTFFLPVFLATFFLLSYSLKGTNPWPVNVYFSAYLNALDLTAPIETRTAFLLLSTVVLAVMVFGIFMFATALPPLTQSPPKSLSRWDRFSLRIGQEARQAFYRAVISYADPYQFPAPLNLLHFLIIKIPSSSELFGIRISFLPELERILWRITVGPLMLLTAALVWILWSIGL